MERSAACAISFCRCESSAVAESVISACGSRPTSPPHGLREEPLIVLVAERFRCLQGAIEVSLVLLSMAWFA